MNHTTVRRFAFIVASAVFSMVPAVPRSRRHRPLALLAVAATAVVAGCSDGEPASNAGETAPARSGSVASAAEANATVAATHPPATAPPSIDPPVTTASTVESSTHSPETSVDQLAAQIEALLADAIQPGSIRWDKGGVDLPPTAAVAAVRIPGHADVLVAVGENVDGSPSDGEAPFGVAGLTESIVRTIAFQLVDEGLLDPNVTVDQWVPTYPNADRVTVQMLLDDATGWGDYGVIEPDPVIADLGRAWTLREAVELRAPTMTTIGEPGTRTDDRGTNEMMLGLIIQETAGKPLTELVHERVTEPAGLDDTTLLDGSSSPDHYRHGVFVFNGAPLDTSAFDGTSFTTWNLATTSSVSTPTDLLDLLDAWTTGDLFTTDRTAAPDRFAPDPAGNPNTYTGLGVPFNAYCPCTEVDGGIEPTAIGRTPNALGTRTYLLRYSDGISVVVNVNSNELANADDLLGVVQNLHDLAAEAI